MTVEFCDENGLNANTRYITLNGQNVTSSFKVASYQGPGYCNDYRRDTATVTLTAGLNELVGEMQDIGGNYGQGGGSITYTTVLVTPDNHNIAAPQRVSGLQQAFWVKNIGTTAYTYDLTRNCTANVSPCSSSSSVTLSAGDSTSVAVTYSTGNSGTSGTIKLHASVSGFPASKDSGYVNVNNHVSLSVSTDLNNNDHQRVDLCSWNCFAVSHSQSTVPYLSGDRPRNIALAYHGDRVAVQPFLYARTSIMAGAPSVDEYWLEAKDSAGAYIPFRNGDNGKTRFSGSLEPRHLVAQFDASSWPTGMHTIQLIVSAVRATYQEASTTNLKVMVVNELKSPVARGWTIAGVQRIYPLVGGVLLTEGDGSAVYFSCPSTCTSPSGEFSKVTISGSGSSTLYTRSYPDSSKAWFNYLGRVDSIGDPFGNKTRYEYDGSGRLVKVFDPFWVYSGVNRSYIALSYGSYGLSQIQEPGADGSPTGGRVTLVGVSADSTLRVVIDPDGDSTNFVYNASRRLERVIDRRRDTTRFEYDTTTKMRKLILPRDSLKLANGQLADTTPVVQLISWQGRGLPTSSTTVTAATSIHPDSVKATTTDPVGNITTFAVDRWGQPLRMTDALGRVTVIERTGIFATTIQHSTKAVDRFSYIGPRISWEVLHGQDTTYYDYDTYGELWRIRGSKLPTREFFRGAPGRIDSTKVAGARTRIWYDAVGRDTLIEDPSGHKTSKRYHWPLANTDSTSFPGGRYQKVKFDRYGRDSVVQVNGAAARTIIYDVMNRPTLMYDGVNPNPIRLGYDQRALRRIEDQKGQVYRFDVNSLGWTTREYDPADTLSRYILYRYNPAGLMTGWTNRRGEQITLKHDALYRLVSRSGTNIVSDSFAYATDTLGATGMRLLALNTVSRDTAFVSRSGWTDSVVTRFATDDSKRFVIRYGRDTRGRVTTTSVSGSNTSIAFAPRTMYWGNVGSIDSASLDGYVTMFGANGDQRRRATTWPYGLTRYDSVTTMHQLSQTSYSSSGVNTELWRGFGYDLQSRIVEEDRINPTGGYKVRQFSYSDLGQIRRLELATVSTASSGCPGTEVIDDNGQSCISSQYYTPTHTYGLHYDAAGNLEKERDSTTAISVLATYGTGNRLSAWDGTPYVSDLDGNISRKRNGADSIRYYWSADNKLTRVTGGTLDVIYEYNAWGHLVRRKRNSSVDRHFLWDDEHLLAELDGTLGSRMAEYSHLPGIDWPHAIVTGPQSIASRRYFHEDASGSVIGITANVFGGASIEARFDYNPWGLLEQSSGAVADTNRLRWKGFAWEGDSTQLYYARNRWYDPRTRRFMTEDPMGLKAGINKYLFGSNDPINKLDPFGLHVCFESAADAKKLMEQTGTSFELDDDKCIKRNTFRFVDPSKHLNLAFDTYNRMWAEETFTVRYGVSSNPYESFVRLGQIIAPIGEDALARYGRCSVRETVEDLGLDAVAAGAGVYYGYLKGQMTSGQLAGKLRQAATAVRVRPGAVVRGGVYGLAASLALHYGWCAFVTGGR